MADSNDLMALAQPGAYERPLLICMPLAAASMDAPEPTPATGARS